MARASRGSATPEVKNVQTGNAEDDDIVCSVGKLTAGVKAHRVERVHREMERLYWTKEWSIVHHAPSVVH